MTTFGHFMKINTLYYTIYIFFILFLGCRIPNFAQDRSSSAPYISGDTFRAYADFIIDETNIPFYPDRVRPGSTIFVKTDLLNLFFNTIHPLIASPYILITHNSDHPAPGNCKMLLDDEKLILWFAQNVENYSHPKLQPIPIGIANKYWGHGNTMLIDAARNQLQSTTRNQLLSMDFALGTYPKERKAVYNQFVFEPYCSRAFGMDFWSYLLNLTTVKFILSPRGNGLDCHRTWEALYLGAIPIVRTSTLNPLYDGLPVVIIGNWQEVTETFLNQKYSEMNLREYNCEKLYADYWFKLIDSYKINYKQ
jgi:hypothetical protein